VHRRLAQTPIYRLRRARRVFPHERASQFPCDSQPCASEDIDSKTAAVCACGVVSSQDSSNAQDGQRAGPAHLCPTQPCAPCVTADPQLSYALSARGMLVAAWGDVVLRATTTAQCFSPGGRCDETPVTRHWLRVLAWRDRRSLRSAGHLQVTGRRVQDKLASGVWWAAGFGMCLQDGGS
jgi:hypothetical protein